MSTFAILITNLLIILPNINCCNITCVPNDEFINKNDEIMTTTKEWDDFMDLLDEKTFKMTYPITCNNGTTIVIDYQSNLLWNVRFKLYYDNLDNTRKQLMDCYCDQIDCGEPFRDCIQQVRLQMIDYLNTKWQQDIDNLLLKLCNPI